MKQKSYELTNLFTPRIYVVCLSSHHNGILHGDWIYVHTEKQVYDEIQAILESSPLQGKDVVGDWAIHDHWEFGFSLSAYEDISKVVEYADIIKEHETIGQLALAHTRKDVQKANLLLENYIGEYQSLEDYACCYAAEYMKIPESLKPYIDYELLGRHLAVDLIVLEESCFLLQFFYAF